jgi:fimbrial isopeptide formation D2 family protein
VTALFLDSNGNGAFDAGLDTLYVAGVNDPQLDPDQSIAVFILSTIPLAVQDGDRGKVDLAAVATTGTGAPGASFAGLGQGGGDAVVGATGADASDDGFYRVAAASVSFVKSASLADPFGGATQVPGATITYTLTATVAGSGSLANLRISDPVPAGTSYTAASITLDGAALTDAADVDAGSFTGTGISVGLGNVAAGTTRTVTFKVRID